MSFFRRTLYLGIALLATSTISIAEGAAADAAKPNIVIILADDLGWGELGAQGNKQIPTPHIDSIAAAGVRFTSGYVSGPYCSPTRAGLLTGRYQTRFGHEFNPGGGPQAKNGLPLDQKTLADHLKAAGYKTAAVGKWHLGSAPEFYPRKRGFDEFYGTLNNSAFFRPELVDTRKSDQPQRVEEEGFYTTDAYGKRAVEFINANKSTPFFLYLPFNAQHAPLQATEEYLDRFPNIEEKKRKTFAAMMSAMDDAVGDVLAALDKNNLTENTLVVYLTDNGGPTAQTTSSNLPLRGGKATTWDGGVRVPFWMQWKGRIPAGKVYEHPIIQLDLLPTALAAAGVEAPADAKLDGVNLLPYLEGANAEPPHESLFWRFGQQYAVRDGEWKLTAARATNFKPQLFNLTADIGEEHDLTAEQPEKAKELQAKWDQWNAGNIPPKWQAPKARQKRQAQGNRQGRRARRAARQPAEAQP